MALTLSPALSPGDWIAVVAPSGPCSRDELWRGLAWLRARYRVRMTSGILSRTDYLAGEDERRAGELRDAIVDRDVKAIVAVRGGYGTMRILDSQPWSELAMRPKWIIGFSDVTALHTMAWKVGIASIHGPNVAGLGRDPPATIRAAWLAALERPRREHAWPGLRVVREGEARGTLLGGNLTLLHAMAAAGRLVVPAGAMLALEDVGESPYRVDRMLTSLLLGGYLRSVSGLIFGQFERCVPSTDGRTVDEVLEERARGLGIPVLSGAPFGHGVHNEAFVLGADARIRGDTVELFG